MDIYFNELCLNNDSVMQYQDVQRMSKMYKLLREHEITTCRISIESLSGLINAVKDCSYFNNNVYDFIYAFFRVPYEEKIDEEHEDAYLEHSWNCNDSDCYGLALSYIMDSIAYSIVDERWNLPLISIFKDKEQIDVKNIYNESTLDYHSEWLLSLKPLLLEKCTVSPDKKKIHLRDDHGTDILKEFCGKLVRSEYVCCIINSIPFKSNKRHFIHRIKDNGVIEIVLPWTDCGYGIAIKTTGRNYRETKEISRILKDQFGTVDRE